MLTIYSKTALPEDHKGWQDIDEVIKFVAENGLEIGKENYSTQYLEIKYSPPVSATIQVFTRIADEFRGVRPLPFYYRVKETHIYIQHISGVPSDLEELLITKGFAKDKEEQIKS